MVARDRTRPRPARSFPFVVVVVLLAFLLAACSGAPSTPISPTIGPAWPTSSESLSPSQRPTEPVPDVQPSGFTTPPPGSGLPRYSGQTLTWQGCGRGLECADARVPLDYANLDGTAITLGLVRRPATVSPRLGSLFINPGGPGGSGRNYVGYFDAKGLEQYDVVGWDPRGVGASTPVQCFDDAELDAYTSMDVSPDDDGERQALITATRQFGLACLEHSGPLLQHVSTTETVRDLDVLRQVLGEKKLTYFGSSYGTQIGAEYAQLFGPSVGRMVLDGAVEITDDKDDTTQAEGFEQALRSFSQWCADQRCGLGGSADDVQGAIVSLWQRLDASPLRAGRRQLTQQLAVTGVVQALYDSGAGWVAMGQALTYAVDDREGLQLLTLADQYNQRRSDGRFNQFNAAFPAIRCADDTSGSGLASAAADFRRIVRDAPTIGPFMGPDYVCATWPVAPAPAPPTITGPGVAPIVVIGTTGDPATPYDNAVGMARQLESGVLVTFKGEGHLAYDQSACVRGLVRSYLVDGQTPTDGATC